MRLRAFDSRALLADLFGPNPDVVLLFGKNDIRVSCTQRLEFPLQLSLQRTATQRM